MKLWTPLFQYSVACGLRSPNPVTESAMLSDRTKARGPKVAISVPDKEVLERPKILGRSSTSLSGTLMATLGPLALVRSDSIADSVTGFGDLNPQATLYWNKGVHNFMVYGTGNIPVGAYQSTRLSNLGLGH